MAVTTIIFRHTGHVWNDLGVIALWLALSSGESIRIQRSDGNYTVPLNHGYCSLFPDRLELAGPEESVHSFLNTAIEALREQVWQPTKAGKQWWTGPARMLYAGQNKPDFLATYELLPKRGAWRPGPTCDVCEGSELPVRTIGTAHNPFLVSVQKMSGFYSELKAGYWICQACAFAAPFALTQAWFSWGEGFLDLSLLWPAGANLLTVYRFYRLTSDLQLHQSGNVGRNYKPAFDYASDPASLFLDLLCSLWEIWQARLSSESLASVLDELHFHAVQLSKPTQDSNVVSIDRYQTIPDPVGLLHLVQACDIQTRQHRRWNVLISVLRSMPVRRHGSGGKPDVDTHLLNEFAGAVVDLRPTDEALEKRVFEAVRELQADASLLKDFSVGAFRSFVSIYSKEVMDMSPEFLQALQSVGSTLGELIKRTDDRSILYNLRNARNLDDLLDVLSRVVVRYADAFIEGEPELYRGQVRQLIQVVDGTNWRRARSMLSLFAGLKFIELSQKKK